MLKPPGKALCCEYCLCLLVRLGQGLCFCVNRAEKAEAKARQKERVAAILAGTDAAGAGAGVEEALNCWEEEAYEAETLETLAEFGD